MKNNIQKGESLDCVAPTGGVESGKAYAFGKIVVVATVDAAENESFAGVRDRVFMLAKENAVALAFGDDVYLKAGLVSDDAAEVLMGQAVETAGAGTDFVKVLIK
jgi:predicted RecA/RadA family phage recombinase